MKEQFGGVKKLCVAFMDLGKAYETMNREALWNTLKIYSEGRQLRIGGN